MYFYPEKLTVAQAEIAENIVKCILSVLCRVAG